MRQTGRHVFGLAAIAIGVIALVFKDFATYWEPVADDIPGRALLVILASIVSIASGVGLQFVRTRTPSAIALALLYAIWTWLWVRRVVGYPQIFGTWSGCAEELVLVIAAVCIAVNRDDEAPTDARVLPYRMSFGVCAILFGISHFSALVQTEALVPTWLPLGTRFWAVATGVGHIVGGIGLVTGLFDVIAGRALTVMYGSFGLFVWLPKLIEKPTDHIAWAGNAVNLSLIAAVWVVTDAVRRWREIDGSPTRGRSSGPGRAS